MIILLYIFNIVYIHMYYSVYVHHYILCLNSLNLFLISASFPFCFLQVLPVSVVGGAISFGFFLGCGMIIRHLSGRCWCLAASLPGHHSTSKILRQVRRKICQITGSWCEAWCQSRSILDQLESSWAWMASWSAYLSERAATSLQLRCPASQDRSFRSDIQMLGSPKMEPKSAFRPRRSWMFEVLACCFF